MSEPITEAGRNLLANLIRETPTLEADGLADAIALVEAEAQARMMTVVQNALDVARFLRNARTIAGES